MLNKEDKDGIIEFLKERLRIIRDAAEGPEIIIYYDGEENSIEHLGYCLVNGDEIENMNSTIGNIVDLCDHALMDVSF